MNLTELNINKIIFEYLNNRPFLDELKYKTRDILRCFDYDYDKNLGFRRESHWWMVLKSKFHDEWIIDKYWCSNTKEEITTKLWNKNPFKGRRFNSCYIYY